jgi:hypothetical protein
MFSFKYVRKLSLLVAACATVNAGAADLVDQATFESGVPDWVTLGTQASLVTSNPFAGTHAIRGNLNSRVTDPITRIQGSGLYSRVELSPAYLARATTEAYVEYRFRLDDCKWDGSGYGYDSNADPYRVDMKYAYLRTGNDPANSFYFSGGVGEGGSFRLAANNSKWMTETTDTLWGRTTLYFDAPTRVGSDGVWHKFAMYISYRSTNPIMRIYVDDQALIRRDTGKSDIIMPADYRLDTFQLPYTGSAQVDASTNRSGVCNGWQVDDIAVWNGMPDAVGSGVSGTSLPMPPPNFNVQVQ